MRIAYIMGRFPVISETFILNQITGTIDKGNEVDIFALKGVEILDNCQLFVAPSVTATDGNQEGIPNVPKEAMAMGLPVVSTQHSGIPELDQDGISGFLVRERDAEAIAEKLTYLIEHPEIWGQFGREGRAKVEEKNDISKLNDELFELYQPLVNSEEPMAHGNSVTEGKVTSTTAIAAEYTH